MSEAKRMLERLEEQARALYTEEEWKEREKKLEDCMRSLYEEMHLTREKLERRAVPRYY